MSTIARLAALFDSILLEAAELIQELKVHYADRNSGMFVFVAPNYYWGERSPKQDAKLLILTRKYKHFSELVDMSMSDAPESLMKEYDDSKKEIENWLKFDSNWDLAASPLENVKQMNSSASSLKKILATLAAMPSNGVLVVPDTNALLRQADPIAYRQPIGDATFAFVLMPTVLQELDRLKVTHRAPEFREKAQKVISRIKGWRNQGSLSAGVKVDGTILVRAEHKEPRVELGPSWLDASSADDRIIASVLALQSESPSSRVVLVTGDINLLNKADAALIETIDADLIAAA